MSGTPKGKISKLSSITRFASTRKPSLQTEDPVQNAPIKYDFWIGTKAMLFTGPLNILLFFAPIGIISYFIKWPDAATFIFALLALAPLAERLGFVTEQLAIHTNETIGGLLNATFGNATELIVSITALSNGLYRLVQLSLLGSILSNMLLVLGTAFFFGGLRFPSQNFGKVSSQINSSLLVLAVMSILFPYLLTNSNEETIGNEIQYSRGMSVLLFTLYIAFLYFQLFTHKNVYDQVEVEKDRSKVYENPLERSLLAAEDRKDIESVERASDGSVLNGDSSPMHISLAKVGSSISDGRNKDTTTPTVTTISNKENEEEEEEEDILGFRYALFWLGVITVFIALLSEALSSSIENAASSIGVSGVFLAAIVLPIVGNAAEHAGAVMFAMKGKVDLTLGVAIGSSTQIALCVIPLLVIIGWLSGNDLSLNFGGFESFSLFLSVILVTFAIKDGTSNWLMGIILMVAYFMISIGFCVHTNDSLST